MCVVGEMRTSPMNPLAGFVLLASLARRHGEALHPTSTPPLIDVPVYSLSTRGGGGERDTMNVLTYATPVAARPARMWCVSLFRGTASHANFARERRGILQLLGPDHLERGDGELVRLLGGTSGREADKRAVCEELGFPWQRPPDCEGDDGTTAWPDVLPSCVYHLKLELVGDLIDCGSHDVALCEIKSMNSEGNDASDELGYISSRQLRNEGIITELGRIKEGP